MNFGTIMLNQSIIINIKTEDFYKGIADDVEEKFDTSNHECNSIQINRPLTTGKNKKFIRLVKYELGGKIMTEFVAIRPKTYLMEDGNTDKKEKEQKSV